ncbi:MAG: hypothetical protein K2J70_00695 [Muribaculaceae bacterium]|nr:hypothetical protein [Muribaculaceae bacterium]
MASSPSHILGEIIGNFFEDVMKSPIRKLCRKYKVYFDTIGLRPARPTKKISWIDINGSSHDLDYVIERNGTPNKIGTPIAFIEVAWRRYTKHSKNKAQEISGALLPIVEKYKEFAPFKGAILSGVFTESSIRQLENQGFHVLYIPFDKITDSFKKFGIDIFFDETSTEKELSEIIDRIKRCKELDKIGKELLKANKKEIALFINALELSIKRQIDYIFVLPLHGKEMRFDNLDSAISFIKKYSEIPEDAIIDSYVIGILFNDGSHINCVFKDKEMAIDFLNRNVTVN